jgi:hypothetical protein
MGFDSDQLRLANKVHVGDARAGRLVPVKHPAAHGVRRRDDAQQPLAQCVAPRAHRADVAGAGRHPAHRVRVHEADDVAAGFLPPQRPRPIGGHLVSFARAVPHAAGAPRADLAGAYERP